MFLLLSNVLVVIYFVAVGVIDVVNSLRLA